MNLSILVLACVTLIVGQVELTEADCSKLPGCYAGLTTWQQLVTRAAPVGGAEVPNPDFTLTATELNNACSELSGVASCLEGEKRTCNDTNLNRQYTWDSENLIFVCSDSILVSLQFRDCLARTVMYSDIIRQHCYDSLLALEAGLKRLKEVNLLSDPDTATCGALQGYVSCMQENVTNICGEQAGAYWRSVADKSMDTYLNGINLVCAPPPTRRPPGSRSTSTSGPTIRNTPAPTEGPAGKGSQTTGLTGVFAISFFILTLNLRM